MLWEFAEFPGRKGMLGRGSHMSKDRRCKPAGVLGAEETHSVKVQRARIGGT